MSIRPCHLPATVSLTSCLVILIRRPRRAVLARRCTRPRLLPDREQPGCNEMEARAMPCSCMSSPSSMHPPQMLRGKCPACRDPPVRDFSTLPSLAPRLKCRARYGLRKHRSHRSRYVSGAGLTTVGAKHLEAGARVYASKCHEHPG
jgi:hypothetical protein